MTAPVLVIGYGNPLRRDDGVGRVVADRVAQAVHDRSICADVEVIEAHQLTPELAEPLSRADLAIFVDAAADAPAGCVRITPVVDGAVVGGSLLHHLGPQRLLAIARILYGRAPEAWAITVGAESFDHGDALSPAIERLVPQLVRDVALLLAVRLPAPQRGEVSHA